MTKNLTAGNPFRLILSFSVPLFLGNLFQQFYTMVDTMIVSKTLGEDALAAVGSTGSITFFILGFCMGLTGGFSIPIAQAFGAGDEPAVRRFTGNILWLFGIVSVGMTVLTVLLCRPMLVAMKTPNSILEDANAYLVVIFGGIPALMAYNTLSGLMRALGDSKTPFFFLVLASLLNIVLDLFFLLNLRMGVAGAALATVISQGISGLGCFLVILKKFPLLHLSPSHLRPHKATLWRLLAMGLPMGFQFSITAIGSILLQSAVNILGASYVTAVTAASRISNLFSCATDSMGSTMATYCGQNLGAGRLDRVERGVRACTLMGIVYAGFAFLACLLFGRSMTLLFLDAASTELIGLAYQCLLLSAAFFWAVAFVNIYRLSIQGLGYGRLAIFAGVLEMLGRGFIGLVLVPRFGFIAACFSSGAAWVLADLFLIPAYRRVIGTLKKRIPCNTESPHSPKA